MLPESLADRLSAYLDLLFRWNRKINLTALDSLDDAVDRLLLEPLVAARHVQSSTGRLIDLGSGGGSPAIPLALALPELELVMVEAKARKAAFLREAVRVLELRRATVESGRFEEMLDRPDQRGAYSAVSVRAVRLEAAAIRRIAGFLCLGGSLLLFRGPSGPDRLADVPPLGWSATYPLVESLGSRLTIFRRGE